MLLQAGSLQSSSSAKSLYHPTHLRIDSDSNQFQRSFNGRYPPELNYFCLIIFFFFGGGAAFAGQSHKLQLFKAQGELSFPGAALLGPAFWGAICTAGARAMGGYCHGCARGSQVDRQHVPWRKEKSNQAHQRGSAKWWQHLQHCFGSPGLLLSPFGQ